MGIYTDEDGTLRVKDDFISIGSMVSQYINKELSEIEEEQGVNEKTRDRAAYEVDSKTTLSLKAKLLLAGISVKPESKRLKESFAKHLENKEGEDGKSFKEPYRDWETKSS